MAGKGSREDLSPAVVLLVSLGLILFKIETESEDPRSCFPGLATLDRIHI